MMVEVRTAVVVALLAVVVVAPPLPSVVATAAAVTAAMRRRREIRPPSVNLAAERGRWCVPVATIKAVLPP